MRAGDCKHFTGIQHDECAAGVRYITVRDSSGSGPYRWPCLPNSTSYGARRPCSTTCASFEAMTKEEEAAEDARFEAAFKAVMDGRCPDCGAALEVRGNERTTVKVCPTHGFVSRECSRVGEP